MSVYFPQSRSCTTACWACTTGWHPPLYLCTPSPASGLRVVAYLVTLDPVNFLGWSGTKKQPKEKLFGPDIPRTSRDHSCGCSGSKTSGRSSKPWKNKHLDADIHDQNAQTSMIHGGANKVRAENVRADFSFLGEGGGSGFGWGIMIEYLNQGWHPMAWLSATPSRQVAENFKTLLLSKFGNYVKASCRQLGLGCDDMLLGWVFRRPPDYSSNLCLPKTFAN